VKKLRNWSIAAVATTLVIVISVQFLDQPIARFCYPSSAISCSHDSLLGHRAFSTRLR
jgi:hypothetical protein